MPNKGKPVAAAREEAEARWFEDNQEQLLKLFEKAAQEGSLRVGKNSVGITLSRKNGALRTPPSQKVMLRIPTGDVTRARRLAVDKGIGYQTLIKMILHEGLDREEKVRRRA